MCCTLGGSFALTTGQDRAQEKPLLGPEAVLRGPVHEAFGKPVVFNPQPGVTATRKPPELIEELPPEQKPEGDNIVWISGYWFWNDQTQDFLWISGLWRAMPPDHTWVPGYWSTQGDKYVWVSGFWTTTETQEVTYVPQPPETLEAGPNSDPPSADHIWVPGCWIWGERQFAWRPGYWIAAQPEWFWTPAHYCWAPRGYVFIDGYWDYGMERRGLLFAPVYMDASVLAQPQFVYTPSVVIDSRVLSDYLFVWPSRHQYCFGDYYADANLRLGIYPWFAFHRSRFGYDPLFAYASWHHGRRDERWVAAQQERYWRLRENESARPSRTFVDRRGDRRPGQPAQTISLGLALNDLAQQRGQTIHLERVEAERRQAFRTRAREDHRIASDRAKWETQRHDNARPGDNRTASNAPVKWQVPRTTTVVNPKEARVPKAPARPSAPRGDTAGTPQRGGGGRQLPGPEDLLRRPGQGDNRDTTNRPGTPPGRDTNRDTTGRPGTPPGRTQENRDLPTTRGDRDRTRTNQPGREQNPPRDTAPDRTKEPPGRDRNPPTPPPVPPKDPPGRDRNPPRETVPDRSKEPPGRDRNPPPRQNPPDQTKQPPGRDRNPPAPPPNPPRERPKETPPKKDMGG